jgi:hypothetical protein
MMSASACTSVARPNRLAFVAGVNSQLFNERIELRGLCTAITPPQTLDNRLRQMQSGGQRHSIEFPALAAEDRAETSEVPKSQREQIRTRRVGLLVLTIKNGLRPRRHNQVCQVVDGVISQLFR